MLLLKGEADFSTVMDNWSDSTQGCVVLPMEQAQQLWQNIEKDMAIVIYK